MDEIRTVAQETELPLPVDKDRIMELDGILQKYKSGKARLEKRVVASEQWWKMRNEAEEEKKDIGWSGGFRAKSGWLHNVIVSKHADAMENYPEPIVLPREPGDRQQAKTLSEVIPVVLEQAYFEKVYSDAWWDKLKTGTGVYKITWDSDKNDGMGDIGIERVDLLSVFWEPGVRDIQKSRYFFHVELRSDEELERRYPQLEGKLKGQSRTLTRFLYDDTVPTDGKSYVVDCYYRVVENGKTVLHFCQYVNDVILASTENDAAQQARMQAQIDLQGGMGAPGMQAPPKRGLYDHGKYPFVFDALWPIEGSPCGYGYVDLSMNAQIQLDMMDTAFIKNTMVGATPRYFLRQGASINIDEWRNINSPIVHVTGQLDDSGIRPVDYSPLAGNYLNFYQNKIMELRETSGNTEAANGVTGGGVTAASAIAALQEAAGKTSRDATRSSYRCFEEITEMIIELIRQFYDMPRQFRITGENGEMQFASLDNAAMQPQPIGVGGVDLGLRLPVYDVKVKIQKRNAFSRMGQNELALQLFNMGFFNPQYATPALACIEMMDFEGKDELTQRLAMNGTIFDQLRQTQMMLMQMIARYEPQNAQAAAQQLGLTEPPPAAGGGGVPQQGELGGNPIADRARDRTSKTTEV